jgi:DNA-binding transcriptional MerR regulator
MSTSAAHLDGIEIGMTLRIGTKAGLNPAPDGADSIQISELAERIGTTPRAIRYYEELNLITPHRTQAGARTYCPDTRRTLEVIVTLRRAGASVDQIRHILAGPTNRENQHQEVSLLCRPVFAICTAKSST